MAALFVATVSLDSNRCTIRLRVRLHLPSFFLHKKGNYGESVAIRRNKTPSIRAGTYLGILLDSRGISLDRPPALLLLLLLRPNPFDEEPRRRPRRSERAASFSRRPSAVASFKSRPTRTGAGTRRSARQSKGRLLLFCFCSLHCVCVGFFFNSNFMNVAPIYSTRDWNVPFIRYHWYWILLLVRYWIVLEFTLFSSSTWFQLDLKWFLSTYHSLPVTKWCPTRKGWTRFDCRLILTEFLYRVAQFVPLGLARNGSSMDLAGAADGRGCGLGGDDVVDDVVAPRRLRQRNRRRESPIQVCVFDSIMSQLSLSIPFRASLRYRFLIASESISDFWKMDFLMRYLVSKRIWINSRYTNHRINNTSKPSSMNQKKTGEKETEWTVRRFVGFEVSCSLQSVHDGALREQAVPVADDGERHLLPGRRVPRPRRQRQRPLRPRIRRLLPLYCLSLG